MPKIKRKRQAPHERTYVSDLELRDALEAKLDTRELQALERQIRRSVDKDAAKACRGCAYLGGPPCRSCDYILITGRRRGCPGGEGCIRREERRRKKR